jgi:catechol 2,3-dioxygenase
MEKFHLSENVYVKTIAIRVKDVEKMIYFYKHVLGFVLKIEENNLSILGSTEKDSRLLILEELEADEVSSQRSFCFSLAIPTEAEFGSLLRRITSHNYPIDNSAEVDTRRSIFLKDPEGNEIEISYQKEAGDMTHFDIGELLRQSDLLYSSLSDGVQFDRIYLPVSNQPKNHAFYHEMLGMVAEENNTEQLSMNNGHFFVQLTKGLENAVPCNSDEGTLGLDFFVVLLNCEAEMSALKEHLEANQQEFFVDKKLTILTIYDPSRIEWWFVRDEQWI